MTVSRTSLFARIAGVLTVASLGLGGPAAAQTSPPPFRLDGGQAPTTAPATDGILGFIQSTQADLFQLLREATVALSRGDSAGFAVLLGLSFAYGIFHAAGPGHGKVVLSTYLLAEGRTVRRGIALAFVAAMVQGAAALVLVSVLSLVFSAVGRTIQRAAMALEIASYAAIGLLGLYLIRRGWRRWRRLGAPAPVMATLVAGEAPQSHDRGHDHRHGPGHQAHDPHSAQDNHPAHGHHHGHNHDGHDHGPGCGHAHLPPPEAGWREGLGIAVAIGLRPCSGAILVLVFCLANGLFLAGGFSVLAMALGTAITTSALAALAVGGHHLILSRLDGGGAVRLSAGLTVLAGGALAVAGALLLAAGPATPPV